MANDRWIMAVVLAGALAWPALADDRALAADPDGKRVSPAMARLERGRPYDRIYTQGAGPGEAGARAGRSVYARRDYRSGDLGIQQIGRYRWRPAPSRYSLLARNVFALAHCPLGVPAGAVCIRAAAGRNADAFVRALLESPNAETVPILRSLGIPVIEDVPPIVIINPD
jgi:hypothetical protein